jgi:hypothetical protein
MSGNKGTGSGVYVRSIHATVDYHSPGVQHLDKMDSGSKNLQ